MRQALTFIALSILLALPLHALTTTHSRLPPSGGDVVLSFDSAVFLGGHEWQHGSDIAVDIGQTFFLNRTVRLDRITVKVRAQTDIGGESATLWIGSYSNATDHSMNQVLRAEAGMIARDLPIGQDRYLTFDLANPVLLQEYRQYGFVLGFSGGGGVNNARALIHHMGSDVYARGQAVADFGAFTQGLSEDLVFFLHGLGGGDPIDPPVEPEADEILYLHGSRFRATVYWRTAEGAEGYGKADAMTDETGCFWFFRDENLEIFAKVLDGCAINDRYWVFIAGLTNVEATIKVHDIQTGLTKTYYNRLGQNFQPIFDTGALASCP